MYAWNDLANLEVLRVSDAVDHILRFLAERTERAFFVGLLVRLLCSGDTGTCESVSGLLVCECDRVLGPLGGNPWILTYYSTIIKTFIDFILTRRLQAPTQSLFL